MSAAIRALERHASDIIARRGMSADAVAQLDAVFEEHAKRAQVAPNWPRGVLVDIPVTAVVAAVGVPGLPDRDAVAIACAYLSEHVLEHVSKNTFARVDVLGDSDVSLVLSPGGYSPGCARAELASPGYRTYNLPPADAPPAKRARKIKRADAAPEAVVSAEAAAPADGE